MTDLELEFEHIWLEASAERWTQLERFLFSYFCYREGHLTNHNKPSFDIARSRCARSDSVTTITQADLEPVVPLAVIIGEIKRYSRDGELTPTTLQRILNSLLDYVVITKQEKAELKKAGLLNAMPAPWYKSEERDPHSRLVKGKITVLHFQK